jgi:hypothetical protein
MSNFKNFRFQAQILRGCFRSRQIKKAVSQHARRLFLFYELNYLTYPQITPINTDFMKRFILMPCNRCRVGESMKIRVIRG